jgi:hypothetical protein
MKEKKWTPERIANIRKELGLEAPVKMRSGWRSKSEAPLVLIINPSKGLFNWIFGISFVGPSPRGEGARFYFDLALFRFALLLASRSR